MARTKPESGGIPKGETGGYISAKEVAARLKCSVRHAQNLGTVERKLQSWKTESGDLLFDPEEVELYAGSAELSSSITFETLLRHSENQEGAVKQAQGFADKLFDKALDSLRIMAEENEALRKRVFHLEERLSKNFEEMEEARSKNHERRLELMKEEFLLDSKSQMWGALKQAFELAAPDVLKRLGLQPSLAPAKPTSEPTWQTKENLGLEDMQAAAWDMLMLVGEISPEQIHALGEWLTPSQSSRLRAARAIADELKKGEKQDGASVNTTNVGMGSPENSKSASP